MRADLSHRANSGAPASRYRLYVVELGRFHGVDGRPAVYVGSTGSPPECRLAEHLAGGFTSARRVRRYGTRLLPEL